MKFVPKRPFSSELKKSVGYTAEGSKKTSYGIRLHFGDKYKTALSEEMYRLLELSDGDKTLAELVELAGCGNKTEEDIVDELIDLWSLRLIHLHPFETIALATV